MDDKILLDALAQHLKEHPEIEQPGFVPPDVQGEMLDAERLNDFPPTKEQP